MEKELTVELLDQVGFRLADGHYMMGAWELREKGGEWQIRRDFSKWKRVGSLGHMLDTIYDMGCHDGRKGFVKQLKGLFEVD